MDFINIDYRLDTFCVITFTERIDVLYMLLVGTIHFNN